jgi:hypothetical protein
VKLAELAPAATVTLAGTVTAALLLVNDTLAPPLGAAPVREMVQVSLPAPVTEALGHDTEPKVAEFDVWPEASV